MDVGGVRTFVGRLATRPVLAGAAACMALAVAIIWSVRQSGLTREALDRAVAAEQAAARVRSDFEQSRGRLQAGGHPARDPAVRRSQYDDPREIERVKQLYAEIEGLTHIRERVDKKLGPEPQGPPNPPEAPPGMP